MFWALNGATRTPRRWSSRHSPATTGSCPASLAVPHTISAPRTAAPPRGGRGPASSGTAMRTWSGRPKLVQSRTTIAVRRQAVAQAAAPGTSTQGGVRRLDGRGRARRSSVDELVAQVRRSPAAHAGRSTVASRSGRAGAGQPVHRPRRLARGEPRGRVVGQHVAEAQARAGEHLGERADDHGRRRRRGSTRRWRAGRTPRPRRRRARRRRPARPVGLCGLLTATVGPAARRAGAERELGLAATPPAELGRRPGRSPRCRRWSAAAGPGRRPSPRPAPPSPRAGRGSGRRASRWRRHARGRRRAHAG